MDGRKAEPAQLPLRSGKKSVCISLSASLTPKVPKLTGVSTRSCCVLRQFCVGGWDRPRASPPSSPSSVAGSVPPLPSSSAAALPALGFASALPVLGIPLATAAPLPPPPAHSPGPFPRMGCGKQLSFAHRGSQLDHCSDLSLRMASAIKDTAMVFPRPPCHFLWDRARERWHRCCSWKK